MQIGAAMFFTDYSITAPAIARALEERQFESLWAPEHSHIPVATKSSFPLWDAIPKKILRRNGSVRESDCGGRSD